MLFVDGLHAAALKTDVLRVAAVALPIGHVHADACEPLALAHSDEARPAWPLTDVGRIEAAILLDLLFKLFQGGLSQLFVHFDEEDVLEALPRVIRASLSDFEMPEFGVLLL